MDNKKINYKFIILLLLLAGAFVAVFCAVKFYRVKDAAETEIVSKLEYLPLYKGECNLYFNLEYDLSKKTKDDIAQFRKEKVKQYSFLNIYPLNYEPLKPRHGSAPHKSIYGTITDGVDWTPHAAFYAANPYYLIAVACAGTISDFGLRARDFPYLQYSYGRIFVTYTGIAAQKWLYCAFNGPGEKDLIGLIGVNALDSGFCWAYLDKTQSKNIDPNYQAPPSNFMNTPHKFQGFYHVGQYQKNNLSPYDAGAVVKLQSETAQTYLYVKLWKEKPKNPSDKEDLTYIITVSPPN